MTLTDRESELVSNILIKIMTLADYDPDFKQFGSDTHQYKWHDPASLWDVEAFEKKHKIELPRDYKIFLTFISNGAPFVGYGLYPFEDVEVLGDLDKDNILYPHMETDDFSALVTMIETDLGKDPTSEIYNGLLLIGTEGCGYDFGIVVTGKYKGRILLTDGNLDNPFIFSYDLNFLDLYERWLDAFELGLDPSRVLLTISKSQEALLDNYRKSDSLHYKKDIIRTLDSYDHLDDETIENIKVIYSEENHAVLKTSLLRIVNKLDPRFVEGEVRSHLYSDDIENIEHFIMHESELLRMSDDDFARLFSNLDDLVDRNQSIFRLVSTLLVQSDYHQFSSYEKYLTDERGDVIEMAIQVIGKTPDFRKRKEEIYFLLEHDNPRVVEKLLRVLIDSTMTDEYLELFKPLVLKFEDDDLIPSLIERYLHKIKVDLDYYK